MSQKMIDDEGRVGRAKPVEFSLFPGNGGDSYSHGRTNRNKRGVTRLRSHLFGELLLARSDGSEQFGDDCAMECLDV